MRANGVLYQAATGRIVQYVECDQADLPHYLKTGLAFKACGPVDLQRTRVDPGTRQLIDTGPVRSQREQTFLDRKQAYLAAWPIHAQLEAHAEAAAGRPEKLNRMLADLAAIKEAHPV